MEATEIHLQSARMTRDYIKAFRASPEKRGLLPHNFHHYLRSISAYALRATQDSESYRAELEKFDGAVFFEEYLQLFRTGEHAPVFRHVSADAIDLVAIPLALQRRDLADSYILEALAPAESTPFWKTYIAGLIALVNQQGFAYELPKKLRGMEKHWSLYLELMAALTRKEPVDSVFAQIQSSFDRCNLDRRLQNTTHIDPMGLDPVPWDLRALYVSTLASAGPNNSFQGTRRQAARP